MKIHHIAISVTNLERSVKFYKDTLGFVELQRFTKPGWNGETAILELKGMRLEVFGFKDYQNKQNVLMNLKVIGLKHIGIHVDNVKQKYEELKGYGIDIDAPIKGTTCAWFCFFRDPDGIPIELYEPNTK